MDTEKYNPKYIEPKWIKFWAENPDLYAADDASEKPKKYILDMFPYPSGEGLHTGHVESYTATDIMARYLRAKGYNVLHPQGWDAFGLPAENFAIKTQVHPTETTKKAIANFKRQMNMVGLSYDWSREVNSSAPDYYRWTQWFFLQLFKNGLAYRAKAKVNWCESCKTVLANEQVENGLCERCKNPVIQKDLEQWFFKITDFVEDKNNTSGLISGLDKVDWPESTKAAQRNWIGRSEGATVKFQIANDKFQINSKFENQNSKKFVEAFTTRVDTIYGATYVVLAPEHKIIEELKDRIENYDEVIKYINETKKKSDLDRMESKVKTGVEVKGIKVINPFNGEELPLWVADYVLAQYGTGAVMAVPAHDERDFEFAKKYDLPIFQSITPDKNEYERSLQVLEVLDKITEAAAEKNIKFWLLGGTACAFHSSIIYRGLSDLDVIIKDKDKFKDFINLLEKIGFKKIREKKLSDRLTNYIFKDSNDVEIDIGEYVGEFGLNDDDFEEDEKKLGKFKARVLSKRFHFELKKVLINKRSKAEDVTKDNLDVEYLKGKVFTSDGITVNSGEYSGLTSEEAREKMTAWLEENNLGSRKVNYKLRDWLVSRQRYWGAPIPIVYCEKCGTIPVSEKDLPVELPDDVDFKPTGESPLKYSKKFHNVKCPVCGHEAMRESDTMDTFVCSSWYYFRYSDPKNDKEFAAKELIEKWLPVDLYVGGAEHTVLHLLYSRFFTKVLHNLNYIDFDEPFAKLRHQGIILAEDGRKMSKSLGNVVNPDDEVKRWGADALRLFEMFMGPLEDMKPWQTNGLVGVYRFLEKVWRLQLKVQSEKLKVAVQSSKLNSSIHKTIKKVGEDIENLRFNTAISQLMILANELEKQEEIAATDYEILIRLLSPFAPFIAEELWNKLGHNESIFKEKWPAYDPELIKDAEIELVIQVNGKVRDRLQVAADLSEEEAKRLALASEKVKSFLGEKEIKKIIYVKGRLVNIVA